MKAPQIIFIVLEVLGLGVALAQHGTKKTGTNSFWVTLLSTIITVGLLWWGGFWS